MNKLKIIKILKIFFSFRILVIVRIFIASNVVAKLLINWIYCIHKIYGKYIQNYAENIKKLNKISFCSNNDDMNFIFFNLG